MEIRYWDHPRTCGEQICTNLASFKCQGSPPHMRGTAWGYHSKAKGVRITPAHAGNRTGDCGASSATGDHPRTCGEQSIPPCRICTEKGSPPHMRGTGKIRLFADIFGGSPPHMRGTVGKNFMSQLFIRITPAHAGNRIYPPRILLSIKDHPRTCGEQSKKSWKKESGLGSPPHMRGTEVFMK